MNWCFPEVSQFGSLDAQCASEFGQGSTMNNWIGFACGEGNAFMVCTQQVPCPCKMGPNTIELCFNLDSSYGKGSANDQCSFMLGGTTSVLGSGGTCNPGMGMPPGMGTWVTCQYTNQAMCL
jgi:hypothetical protein